MSELISLNTHGIRLFHGRLYNHDYLWFSSNEISRVSTTQPFLHNYALCYTLSRRSPRTCVGSVPMYVTNPDGEFGAMPVYATPGRAERVQRTAITFNAINDLSLTTGDTKTLNTPNFGKRIYVNLQWEPQDAVHPQAGYECYVFTFGGYQLPGVFRLGKKGSPVRARWHEVENPVASFRTEAIEPTHAVNPLDVGGRRVTFDIVFIPPHSIMRTSTIADDWFIMSGAHRVHIPLRVLKRIG
ncbi:MAG: type I-D CRISPR-associated protein Cas5/Csc1, partial [Abitibacteriaceae bacterium]|nr:type I-D CRISPR-associated protein Cas5/Csc1 [Abditibacteriaceae bacterium]